MAATVAWQTFGGKSFRCSKRTYSHLRRTYWRLKVRNPFAKLHVIQGAYNSTIAASAGTHDYDAVLDVRITGMTWPKAQAFLRGQGWAAWWRHTGTWENPASWHIHMISIPPGLTSRPTAAEVQTAYTRLGIRVGVYVPGQIADYYRHAQGLAGQHNAGSDPTWHPPVINATVFK